MYSCDNDEHTHEWEYYVVKSSTCLNKGLLEKICAECGEKEYEDIQPIGHFFLQGACIYCGTEGNNSSSLPSVAMPQNANNSAKWSFSKIHETAQTLGYPSDYADFMYEVGKNATIDSIYLDSLGFLHLDASSEITNPNNQEYANFQISLPLLVGKVSPQNDGASLGTIEKMQLKNSIATITYTDGTQVIAGSLSSEASDRIDGFGINPNNELVIYYANNTISFAGTVSVGQPPENNALILYREIEGGYTVVSVIDKETTSIKIPLSHKGKPITQIDNYAFEQCKNLKTVIIGENVNYVNPNAFDGLTDCVIYCEAQKNTFFYIPTTLTSYFKGEWYYDNGIPKANIS